MQVQASLNIYSGSEELTGKTYKGCGVRNVEEPMAHILSFCKIARYLLIGLMRLGDRRARSWLGNASRNERTMLESLHQVSIMLPFHIRNTYNGNCPIAFEKQMH